MKTKSIAVAALLLPLVCTALQMRPLSIQELTERAQIVLHGNITSKTVQRDPEGRIYTRLEFALTETWKGRPQRTPFVIVQAGGTLGGESARVDGQEECSVGEELVVFLVLNQRGEGLVIGLVQGRFKVANDENGEKIVHNHFHGIAPGGGKSASATVTGATPRPGRLSLSDLKSRVQGGRL